MILSQFAHLQQRILCGQALAELVIHGGRGCPGVGAPFGGKLGQIGSIQGVGFAFAWERFHIIVDLCRVDDTYDIPGFVEGDRQGNPITAGRFHHNQRRARGNTGLVELLLEGSKAHRGLWERHRSECRVGITRLGGRKGCSSDIDAHNN